MKTEKIVINSGQDGRAYCINIIFDPIKYIIIIVINIYCRDTVHIHRKKILETYISTITIII